MSYCEIVRIIFISSFTSSPLRLPLTYSPSFIEPPSPLVVLLKETLDPCPATTLLHI